MVVRVPLNCKCGPRFPPPSFPRRETLNKRHSRAAGNPGGGGSLDCVASLPALVCSESYARVSDSGNPSPAECLLMTQEAGRHLISSRTWADMLGSVNRPRPGCGRYGRAPSPGRARPGSRMGRCPAELRRAPIRPCRTRPRMRCCSCASAPRTWPRHRAP